jgi:hypothetical protein
VGYRTTGSLKDPLSYKPACCRRRLWASRGTLRCACGCRRCAGRESRLFQNGEGTSERPFGSRSRARPLAVEDPGGPGRPRGASPKVARKPRGGWPPGRGGAAGGGTASGRMKPKRGANPSASGEQPAGGFGLRVREAPRTGLRVARTTRRGSDRREVRSRRAANVAGATDLVRGADGPGGSNP